MMTSTIPPGAPRHRPLDVITAGVAGPARHEEVAELDTTAPPTTTRRRAGLADPMHPSVLGSIIGGAGATVFVLVNRSSLPGAWPAVALLLWIVLVAAAVWTVLLRPRVLADPEPPSRFAGLVYLACVAGMLVGTVVGHALLAALDRTELMPAVVVLAVGLHFLPFAAAFHAPVFRWLGCGVATLGVVGLLWGWAGGAVAAAAVAVAAGLLMLAVITHAAWADGR
ncbi:hypothetical protein [Luteipulveratus flavus]|uniref:Uncharacterized protein n=1 Tax=Luteipulveratus flavus TaxID=3031728 RepID=A0ABT6C4Q0_9MICO|nr:hypothetical protein [Luteipulveratus sp. YIM 133296]MDF8263855.1 hypothetical protein [Luteipulveratus sp. YIM 133296]